MSTKKNTQPAAEVVEEVVAPVVEKKAPEKTPKFGIVANCIRVNVRKNASIEAEILTELEAGTSVTVMNKSGEFFKIKTPVGLNGYIMADYLTVE